MNPERIVGIVARQEALNPVEEGLQKLLHQAFSSAGSSGKKIKNAWNGTWLGHPLHVVLTDVPIGAWTAALIFDAVESISGRDEFATAADASVMVGLVGAVGAAAAGLTDWQDVDPPARRIGLVHGLLNLSGTGLFAASLIMRKRDSRAKGRSLSLLGYAIAAIAGFLGGDLVYDQRLGVDHTAGQRFPEEFVPVMAESELINDKPMCVEYDGVPILIVRHDNRIFALANTCSHLGGPLAEGTLIGSSVQCPWHGSRFALEDGRVLDGPAVHPQPSMETRIRNGQIEIRRYNRSAAQQ
jgi:nitrite reductase/ring-hydroxylating ferredoxin subunit/uncharacterized membrane protein